MNGKKYTSVGRWAPYALLRSRMFVESEAHLVWRIERIARWYPLYLKRSIPKHKDPKTVIAKMIKEYKTDIDRAERQMLARGALRQNRPPQSTLKLFAYRHSWVLLATEKGEATVYDPRQFTHMRDVPLEVFDYRLRLRCEHGKKGIRRYRTDTFMTYELYEYALTTFETEALCRSKPYLRKMFRNWFFDRGIYAYKGTLKQQLKILHEVNRLRRKYRLPVIEHDCIRFYNPFYRKRVDFNQ